MTESTTRVFPEHAPRIQPVGSHWKTYRDVIEKNVKRLGREFASSVPVVLYHRGSDGEEIANEWTIGDFRSSYDSTVNEVTDALREMSATLGKGCHKFELRAEKPGAPVKRCGHFNVQVWWTEERIETPASTDATALDGMRELVKHLQATIADERKASQGKDATIARIIENTTKQIAAVLERNALLETKLAKESDVRIAEAETRAREAAEAAANAPAETDDMLAQAMSIFGPSISDSLARELAPELRAMAKRFLPDLAAAMDEAAQAAALDPELAGGGDVIQ